VKEVKKLSDNWSDVRIVVVQWEEEEESVSELGPEVRSTTESTEPMLKLLLARGR
jgi:hypothetical protein